jgi:hypothetical protein
MNKRLTAALAFTLLCALLLGGCGSSSTTSTSANGSSLVTVSIGGNGKVASLKVRPTTLLARMELKLKRLWQDSLAYASPFPDTVKKFRVTVTAADMQADSLTLNLPSALDEAVSGSFEVRNGAARVFTGELLNLDNKPVYRKISEPYNLVGNPVTVEFSGWGDPVAPLSTVVVIGTVSDNSANNAPISGATVTFNNGNSTKTATTGPTGLYFIEVTPGAYSITVAKTGFASTPAPSNVAVQPSPTGEFVTINLSVSQL